MTAPVLDITNPDAIGTDLETSSRQLAVAIAASSTIETRDDAAMAVADRQKIADLRKTVVEYFAPIKSMAHQLHKKICDRENAILGPLDARDRAVRDALGTFTRAQDAIRIAAEQAEADRRKAAQQATAVHEAAILESSGMPDLAAAIVEDAITAPPPVVTLPDVARSVPGLKFRKVWKWRYAGTAADRERVLLLIPRQFLAVDEVKVNSYVRAMKSSGSIPGIDIYSVDEPVR